MSLESPLDFMKPMDHIDPADLISSYQPSDIDWLNKDPFEILPWDLSSMDQTFSNPFAEGNGLAEFDPRNTSSYTTSNHGSPAGYTAGYTIKTEDAMSDVSPLSDAESETWSPIYSNDNKSGSQSPVVAAHSLGTKENTDNARKASNASSSSSSSSPLSSPKLTTASSSRAPPSNKSARSPPPSDADAAAVMKRKKAAHNAIEKRYRTNMNAKFLALGNAIPRPGGAPFNGGAHTSTSSKGSRKHSLYHARETMSSIAGGRRLPHEKQQQQQQQQQQNKSEILTNALAYINQLQDENSRLKGELLVLKENLLPGNNIMWRR